MMTKALREPCIQKVQKASFTVNNKINLPFLKLKMVSWYSKHKIKYYVKVAKYVQISKFCLHGFDYYLYLDL